jgi:hypothetical protein
MKENIKKNLLFTILVFLSLTIHAQKYQGSIVDSNIPVVSCGTTGM